jgi:hypothetical protein
MLNKDQNLLQEAYLSVSKPMASVPSDEQDEVSVEPNTEISTGPVDELAPKTAATDPALNTDTMVNEPGDDRLSVEDESEEDEMVIDNLASIRESIMKTAAFCAGGGHLEPWQQQKLAIAMDNLAAIARSLRSGAHC